ncbi:LysM peptidoglycan-binding domain-containing protein [Periweissella cryptocerci]|nr:LysM peptidoglycan-binding domain-containing protein [Periweissella cryptocerci]
MATKKEEQTTVTKKSHVVVLGDCLDAIATANGMSVAKLAKINELKGYNIKPGMELKLSVEEVD